MGIVSIGVGIFSPSQDRERGADLVLKIVVSAVLARFLQKSPTILVFYGLLRLQHRSIRTM